MIRSAIILALLAGAAQADSLRIATGGHYPPYIYDPETPQARGLDKDMLDELCARGDYECSWVDLPMGTIFQQLAAGEVDVVVGGFGYSAERDALVDFTCPYVAGGDGRGTFVGTKEDTNLITARIGTLEQSLYQKAMERANRDVIPFPTEEEALDALARGEVAAVFGSHNMVNIAEARGGHFTLGEYPTFSGGTVMAVSEDAIDLRDTLDRLLAEMSEDGTLSRLQMRWMGIDDGDVISRCYDASGLT